MIVSHAALIPAGDSTCLHLSRSGIFVGAVAHGVPQWGPGGKAPIGDLGNKVPQKLKQFANIGYRFSLQKRSKFLKITTERPPDS